MTTDHAPLGPSETPTEDLDTRIARLAPDETFTPSRRESLSIAHNAGVTDNAFAVLASACRLDRKATIVLPQGKFERLSRGRGWARKGRGNDVVWGDREDNGYRVGPGRWTVGSNDGFQRKEQTDWDVEHVIVGGTTWTIAN